MNKQRRKEIENLSDQLNAYAVYLENNSEKTNAQEINGRLDDLASELDSILSEEQNYYDNVPENLQNSDRYYSSEEAINSMESAIDLIRLEIEHDESYKDFIKRVVESLNEAQSELENIG